MSDLRCEDCGRALEFIQTVEVDVSGGVRLGGESSVCPHCAEKMIVGVGDERVYVYFSDFTQSKSADTEATTVRVSPDTYDKLTECKKESETFDDVISRKIGEKWGLVRDD